MEQLQIGGVLFLASISFFFLGYLWARNVQKTQYDSLGSDDDDSQNQDRQIADLNEKVKQLTKQNEELQKKLGTLNKNTDL